MTRHTIIQSVLSTRQSHWVLLSPQGCSYQGDFLEIALQNLIQIPDVV